MLNMISHEDFTRLVNRVAKLEQELQKAQGGEVYLTEENALRYTGLCRDTLYKKFTRGHIPQGEIWRYSPDRRVVFNVERLRQWMRSQDQVNRRKWR